VIYRRQKEDTNATLDCLFFLLPQCVAANVESIDTRVGTEGSGKASALLGFVPRHFGPRGQVITMCDEAMKRRNRQIRRSMSYGGKELAGWLG